MSEQATPSESAIPVQAGTATAAPVLELDGLTSGYNGSAVLRDISLTVHPGEVVALLGANGAGKTTTLLTISGIVKPMGGRVLYLRRRLQGQLARRAGSARRRARTRGARRLLRTDGGGALQARAPRRDAGRGGGLPVLPRA